jgi:molecular chaperone DnaK
MKKPSTNQRCLGIDLGTTYSAAATVDDSGIVKVLPNLDGQLSTPSILSAAGDKILVGEAAKQDKFLHPEFVIEQAKRHMNVATVKGKPIVLMTSPNGMELTAVTVSAEILRYLKISAEQLEGCTFTQAVISVPAYFDGAARQRTKDAARIAGFEEVYIENEPIAAATHYGLAKGRDETIAVVDFGGGTLDVVILRIRQSGQTDTLGIDGDPECGGCNIDEAIFQYAKGILEQRGGKLDPQSDLAGWYELLDACRKAKELLSRRDSALIPIRVGDQRQSVELTYSKLVELSEDVIKTLKTCCQRVLGKAHLTPAEIDRVLLVGGSTRLRFVSEIVKSVFGKEPTIDTDPDLAVAKGCAIIAAVHFGAPDQEIVVDGKVYIASSIKRTEIAAKDLCVAAITRKHKGDTAEYNSPLITAGSVLPANTTTYFSPIHARSNEVTVKIIEGEPGKKSSDYTPLIQAEVPIQPTDEASNENRIEFQVVMDTEGLVKMTVRDKILNKPIPIQFNVKTALSDEEIASQRSQLEARHVVSD